MPPTKINKTTYEVELPSGDKVEIGDKDAPNFKPHLKLNRWGGECFIKVGLSTTKKIKPVIEGDKTKWVDRDIEAHLYPLEPRTVTVKDKEGRDVPFAQNELGGFEFEVVLKKKPKTNQIVLNLETEGLKFYYQPELTAVEIADGAIRPENVVGSYAVYHATRTSMHRSKADAEKYKCGKAFHIYRPKIADADGKWVWGELSLDEQAGTLTTTIPQEFLDSAVYPISTGTTNFGYEVAGTAGADGIGNYVRGSLFQSGAEGGTAVSITAHVNITDTHTSKGAVYLHSDLSLKGETAKVNAIAGARWVTHTFSNGCTIDATTNYVLCAWSSSGFLSYDAGDTDQGHGDFHSYNGYPNPLVPSHADKEYSVYCTYEEAAAPEEYVRTSAVTIGSSMSATRLWAIPRTSALTIGNSVSVTRLFKSIRTSAIIQGIAMTAERAYGVVKTAAISVGIAISVLRGFGKTAPITIGSAITASRAVTKTRTAAVSIGEAVSAFRGFAPIASITIGIAVTAERAVGRVRDSAISIGIAQTATRLSAIIRTAPVAIGDAVSATKARAIIRTAAITQGIAVTAARVYGRFKTAALTIGDSVTAARIVGRVRTASLTIGEAVTASKLYAKEVTAALTIGVSVSATRVWGAARTAALTIGTVIAVTWWSRVIYLSLKVRPMVSDLTLKARSLRLTTKVRSLLLSLLGKEP